MDRRTFLQSGTVLCGLVAFAQSPVVAQTAPALELETIAEGLTSPIAVEFAPGDTDRFFVADQTGQVYVGGPVGLRPEPFFDLTDRMVDINARFDERGLLGLAFHPAFADNGRFYVRYSAPHRQGTPPNYDHTFVLSEFTADGDRADPTTERTVLEIPEPQPNHNSGALAFGPDDYLYVGVGDGGGRNDRGTGHADDWYGAVPGGNGQDVTGNLLGSVLRIDVDAREDGRPYGVPDDNPLVGREGLDEHYAWGFRNPWRISFDGDDLYVADVGQVRHEEVSRVERGGNYGWNVREGEHCFAAADCPTETPDGAPLVGPVIEYPHGGDGPSGISVIGGFVYRGAAIPDLDGTYVFADWQADGRLFVARPAETGLWPITEVPVEPAALLANVLAFGRDAAGELYVCTSGQRGPSGETGAVHRLVSSGGTAAPTTDGTGSGGRTTGPATEATAPGVPGFGPATGLVGVGVAAGLAWALGSRAGRG